MQLLVCRDSPAQQQAVAATQAMCSRLWVATAASRSQAAKLLNADSDRDRGTETEEMRR